VDDSPIELLLQAVAKLDADVAVALFAPDAHLLTVDGRRAAGKDAVRELLVEFFGTLRSTSHRITGQWHEGNVWIAEAEGTYELQDWLKLTALPRAFIARTGPEGIADLRAYGAHELPLTDHPSGEEGMWVGSRWIPPL
jgi:hypothetical protein